MVTLLLASKESLWWMLLEKFDLQEHPGTTSLFGYSESKRDDSNIAIAQIFNDASIAFFLAQQSLVCSMYDELTNPDVPWTLPGYNDQLTQHCDALRQGRYILGQATNGIFELPEITSGPGITEGYFQRKYSDLA